MALAWWDAGRSLWLFWAGLLRVSVMAVGWAWTAVRAAWQMGWLTFRRLLRSPMVLLDWTSRTYFKPGVPWIAFLALLGWCAVEATIFMYTLSPTLRDVLAGITGYETSPWLMGPILWIFLFLLILGSFACVHVFADALRHRRWGEVIQMTLVETFVMFFEVVFLYRELIDAVAPWVAQTTDDTVRLGLISTLSLAGFGWIGVRGMTWFLFGRFGTPAVLAILSRETVLPDGRRGTTRPAMPAVSWEDPVRTLKAELAWFTAEAQRAYEMVTLPVLQLLAAAVNFVLVVITGSPMFALPFHRLGDVMAATPGMREPPESEEHGAGRREGRSLTTPALGAAGATSSGASS